MKRLVHMSNTTIMFGIIALFAVGMIFSPLAASAAPPFNNENFLDLKNAKLKINDDVITDIKFTAEGEIPKVNPGINWGYGIITAGGNVIATTSHPDLPIVDSELQTDETDDVIHNHYVKLGTNELCGLVDPEDPESEFNPSIADLTFESPGDIFVKQNQAILSNLPPSVTGGNFPPEPETFTPGADYQAAASFQLEYVEDEMDSTNFAVCVVDIRALDPLEQSTVIIGEKDFEDHDERPYGDHMKYYDNYEEHHNYDENNYGKHDYKDRSYDNHKRY
jgi:hypothetical protein